MTNILLVGGPAIYHEHLQGQASEDGNLDVHISKTVNDAESVLNKGCRIDVAVQYCVSDLSTELRSLQLLVGVSKNIVVAAYAFRFTSTFITQALRLGCKGFIPFSLPTRSFLGALSVISSGTTFIPLETDVLFHDKRPTLSQNEARILFEVSKGRANKEIAWELGVSEVTVKANLRKICAKLGAANRAEAVAIAYQQGIF